MFTPEERERIYQTAIRQEQAEQALTLVELREVFMRPAVRAAVDRALALQQMKADQVVARL